MTLITRKEDRETCSLDLVKFHCQVFQAEAHGKIPRSWQQLHSENRGISPARSQPKHSKFESPSFASFSHIHLHSCPQMLGEGQRSSRVLLQRSRDTQRSVRMGLLSWGQLSGVVQQWLHQEAPYCRHSHQIHLWWRAGALENRNGAESTSGRAGPEPRFLSWLLITPMLLYKSHSF